MATSVHEPQLVRTPQRTWRRLLPAVFWVVFLAGLAIEGFAPRLKIENRRFVMPFTLTADSGPLHPDVIVDRERHMQWASGLLTLTGAVSLAIWYRRRLTAALMPQGSHPRGQ